MHATSLRTRIPSEPFTVCILNSIHLGKQHNAFNKKLKQNEFSQGSLYPNVYIKIYSLKTNSLSKKLATFLSLLNDTAFFLKVMKDRKTAQTNKYAGITSCLYLARFDSHF